MGSQWKRMRWAIAPLCLSMAVGLVDLPQGQIVPVQAQTTATGGTFAQQLQSLETQAQTYTQQGQTILAQQTYAEAATLAKDTAQDIFETIIPLIGEVHPALAYANQALTLAQKSGDRPLTAEALNLVGAIQFRSGGTSNARRNYQQAIALLQGSPISAPHGYSQVHLGQIEQAIANYPKATAFYNEGLNTFRSLNDTAGEIFALQNIADLAQQQRNAPEALRTYREALQLARQSGNRKAAAATLLVMGDLQKGDRQYVLAQRLYQEALEANQNSSNLQERGKILNRLGALALRTSQHTEATDLFEQALTAAQQAGDLTEQGSILRNISISYQRQGQYEDSFDLLQQAALVFNQMGVRALEAEALAEMAATQNALGNREMAIIYYKQAVQVVESRRKDLTETFPANRDRRLANVDVRLFTPIYRRLADMLITDDRLSEAQQTLDLLKVQEIDSYLRTVEGNEITEQGIADLPSEQAILVKYEPLRDQAIALGKELLALRRIPSVEQTPAQTQRIQKLSQQQQDLTRAFSVFSRSPDVKAALANVSATAREQNLSLNTLRGVADNLRQLDERSIILYPLVLDDRLELIVASPFAPPIRHTVNVSREELNATIAEMRTALTTVRHDTYAEPAQKLYNWLIAPIEGDLQATEATTIIYAPDDHLRYIPLAALNDGDRWLIERFRVNNITAASLTDFTSQPPPVLHILAGAFTEGEYDIKTTTREYLFEGLPFAGKEVNNIVAAIPNTQTLFDQNFTKAQTVPQMDNFNIIHLATHAAFVSGKPKDSFVLFGNGDRVTLEEVQDSWFLTNVDLIVLSACQTAVGGELGNGEEILGFGYLMQDAGAKAAIASLWSVSDGGTQALMNRFYEQLVSGGVSKAEAMRQAQIAMINGELAVDDSLSDTSHPYYWSPFILIGNGL